jgi:hypothetical protein
VSGANLPDEEPDAGNLHVRICEGRGGQPPRLLDFRRGEEGPGSLRTRFSSAPLTAEFHALLQRLATGIACAGFWVDSRAHLLYNHGVERRVQRGLGSTELAEVRPQPRA